MGNSTPNAIKTETPLYFIKNKNLRITPRSIEENRPGTFRGNFFCLGDKPGGVEPGFLAVEVNAQFAERFNRHFNNMLQSTPTESMNMLKQNATLAQQFAQELKTEAMKKSEGHSTLPTYLIKQDYLEGSFVAPEAKRLAQSQAIQNLPLNLQSLGTQIYRLGRLTKPATENKNAILEVTANDIAKGYGMPCQEQRLISGNYQNGSPKFMTACTWDPNFIPIKSIQGSLKKSDYENYLVTHADHSIKNPGQELAMFLVQGDRDVFGSRGQNKGIKNGELFGFDFGHAYRNNPILNTVQDDFSFRQPTDSKEKFKNMSICYDSSQSDRMESVFFMYRAQSTDAKNEQFSIMEQQQIERMITSYRQEKKEPFASRIDAIQAGVEERCFDTYINHFQALIKDPNEKINQSAHTHYRDALESAKTHAITGRTMLLSVFKERMQVTPQQVDLLDHLEKLSLDPEAVSYYSGDGNVRLRHPRVDQAIAGDRVRWTMTPEGDSFVLSANLTQAQQNRIEHIMETFNDPKQSNINPIDIEKKTEGTTFKLIAHNQNELTYLSQTMETALLLSDRKFDDLTDNLTERTSEFDSIESDSEPRSASLDPQSDNLTDSLTERTSELSSIESDSEPRSSMSSDFETVVTHPKDQFMLAKQEPGATLKDNKASERSPTTSDNSASVSQNSTTHSLFNRFKERVWHRGVHEDKKPEETTTSTQQMSTHR